MSVRDKNFQISKIGEPSHPESFFRDYILERSSSEFVASSNAIAAFRAMFPENSFSDVELITVVAALATELRVAVYFDDQRVVTETLNFSANWPR